MPLQSSLLATYVRNAIWNTCFNYTDTSPVLFMTGREIFCNKKTNQWTSLTFLLCISEQENPSKLSYPNVRNKYGQVLKVTKIKREVITCRSFVSIKYHNFSPYYFYHIDAVLPLWHKLQYSITVQIQLLHSQPLMNNNFHFLITVESATFQLLLQETKLHFSLFCLRSEIVLPCLTTCEKPNFY
jgi:hypothetical protein